MYALIHALIKLMHAHKELSSSHTLSYLYKGKKKEGDREQMKRSGCKLSSNWELIPYMFNPDAPGFS